MFEPYTYLITHLPSGKVYYGVRFSKNANPSDLWVKYFTSSNDIKRLIKEDGKDNFSAEVRRTFRTAEEAIAWEATVLHRMNVIHDDRFINRSIPGTTLRFTLSEETKQKMRKPKPPGFGDQMRGNKRASVSKGVPKTKEHAENISKGKKGKAPFKGKDHPRFGKEKSDDELLKISISMKKKRWMNNGFNCAFVESDDFENYTARGYTMGRGSRHFTKE